MAEPLPPNSIFMCYRRADSEEMVDRIYETLAEEFGGAAIFRDIDTIPLGVVFPLYIQNSLRDCPVVLVFIGRDWVTCVDRHGRRRIDDPSDHVRIEVETALALPAARVIPVFVKRAEVPSPEDLPESLRPLRLRSGVTIRSAGPDYKQDIARLSKTLAETVRRTVPVGQDAAEVKRRAEKEAAELRERQLAEQRKLEEAAAQERRARDAEAQDQRAREQKEPEPAAHPAEFERVPAEDVRSTGKESSRSASSAGPSERGADLRYDMQILLEEAAFGCQKEIEITKLDTCEVCQGIGAKPGSRARTCQRCGGHGRVKAASRVKLKIPAGIEHGSRLRTKGNGEAGLRGGLAGDLYIVLHIKEHDVFERKENDLYCEVPVTSGTLATGGEVAVPLLNGQAKLKVPAGTQNGAAFKLRGMGMPVIPPNTRGDLVVRVVLSTFERKVFR